MGPAVGPILSVDPVCEDLILLSVDYLLNRCVVASSLLAPDVKPLRGRSIVVVVVEGPRAASKETSSAQRIFECVFLCRVAYVLRDRCGASGN
jgi:hypothetical protein